MKIILGNYKTSLTQILFRLFSFALLLGMILAQAPMPNAFARAGEPQLILTKTVEDNITTAKVGDVIRYRIRFECSSLTTSCGEMEITDALQAGLTYLPPPASSVPGGFTITPSTAGAPPVTTITIRKADNNLLDGSQYDAVIAVRVNYDLRPLPQNIDNEVNGRIDPPGPVSWQNAVTPPPVTVQIDGVNPDWALTKSLFSPTIDPTVDTDVTYRLSLCPGAVSGNVSLSNIVITDTLPVGAVFVSATDSGIYTPEIPPTPSTVTWTVAGPVTPPSCVTRYVTIRYPSGTFTPGSSSITNAASATADYPDSSGTTCPNCFGSAPTTIIHPIDIIKAVPSYSKSDAGDPVGLSGTARFILSLNTNGTNYPSNSITLTDDLPPELKVTEVTSGGWSASFNYIRAYVEYSTDNKASWTLFPDPPGKPQPVSYNTDATFTAPVANITNVRWRFEYDSDGSLPFDLATTTPGLPYTWEFTSRPEIRVTPRDVDTHADDGTPGTLMPAAVSGTTYDNCIWLSRVDNTGPVIDGCKYQDMTVRGNYVSLRTSKGETPGASYDNLDDPLINSFIADSSILPGDTLRYTITVDMTERSSTDLVDPTILDTLPADLIFVRNGTATLDGGAVAQPMFTQSGQNLTWTWRPLLGGPGLTVPKQALGSHLLTVEFFARIPPGQTPGSRTNNMYVVTDSVDVLCETGTRTADAADVDNDTNAAEGACQNVDAYVVELSAALRGEKWIRSVAAQNSQVVDATTFLPPVSGSCPNGGTAGLAGSSNPFTRFPCISQAFPENSLINNQFVPPPTDPTLDDFEYNLRIFNDGNVDMLNYVLYDILPYYGDKGSGGTLASTARDSEFRPTLRGAVAFISGTGLSDADFTIDYNLTTNPCRPEVFNQAVGLLVPTSCNNAWTLASATTGWTPADWAAVRSYRIRLNAGSVIPPAGASEVRFGVPMNIPADAPQVGTFNNDDPLSHEIAWNSFSHVGSYDAGSIIRDLLASEPRKVGITIPEVTSVGNRVWRDSDNSGTINAPDDTDPGIGGVTVNLYRDANNNGQPDDMDGSGSFDSALDRIAATVTDSGYTDGSGIYHDGGYYLFSNIPYDSANIDNNRYIIGIPASNFTAGQPLENLHSSTGTPAEAQYTNPPSNDLPTKNPDSSDHGIDSSAIPPAPSTEVFSANFILRPATEPAAEADLSDNDRDGPAGTRRGVNAERDNNSDLTVDFGFFGGTDVPFSIGNYVWFDDGLDSLGNLTGTLNDGIRQSTELPVAGARVYLYRDGNNNGIPDASEQIRILSGSVPLYDTTDANGFYLFDNLDPGKYFVQIADSNFAAGGPLDGWYSSQPTGSETLDVNGGTTTAGLDSDDNGVNENNPELRGVFSGVIELTRDFTKPEPLGETHLSGQADPDLNPATPNLGVNPTEWDGPYTPASPPGTPDPDGSRGRYGETDTTSNLTIDFGFIPPMSLGNRVWIDEGAGEATFRAGYNNGVQDGTEAGVAGVRVELWQDKNNNTNLEANEFVRAVTTDANGYYLFDYIQPGDNYYIHIPDDNFGDVGVGDLVAGDPLLNYISSFDATPPADNAIDINDNGIDNATPAANGITSSKIVMAYNTEPLSPPETDLNVSGTYGPNNVGNFGQKDNNSNLTLDFGFVREPRSIGNFLWFDTGTGGGIVNDGILNGGELPVPAGTRVSLYLDANLDNQPDDLGVAGVRTDDWIAFDLTDANGYYLFDNLPPNYYIVGVDRANFATGNLVGYTSSAGNVDNAANNTDSFDNGVDRPQITDAAASPHGILSTRINLTANPLTLPTGEAISGNTSAATGNNPTAGDGAASIGRYGETDLNSDLTIDFGFVDAYSLGNRVWFDTNNDGVMNVGEQPVDGVQVQLFRASGALPTGAALDTQVTANGGYYLFDHLPPGNYVVAITADNFNAAGSYNALVGYWSSMTTMSAAGALSEIAAPDPDAVGADLTAGTADDDVDLDDNGTRYTTAGIYNNMVLSLPVTVGPTGSSEPTNDDDLDTTLPGSQQGQPDGRANMKVDFGFYRTEIGNLVFEDVNLNGAYDAGDTPINGTSVRLYAANNAAEILVGPDGILGSADDAANGVVTGPLAVAHPSWLAGEYHFSGLPAGDYIVRVVAPTGEISTIDTFNIADNNNPDTNIDNNDNGDGEGAGTITSEITNRLTTTPGSTGANGSNTVNQATGTTTDPTVDFGFVAAYSLGNRVWFDTNNSSVLDAGESGITGVRVELYRDTNGNGAYTPGTDTFVGFNNTDANGYYRFDNLFPRDYVVVIPADNFLNMGIGDTVATDPLRGYWSSGTSLNNVSGAPSEGATNDPDTDTDAYNNAASDENGATVFSGSVVNYVSAAAVTLGASAEPLLETNLAASGQGNVDARANMTVDFGFYRTEIGNLVFRDNDQSGHYNAGDTPTNNIVVRLYDDANHEVQVGPDGILGTNDDAAGGVVTGPLAVFHPGWAAGEYHFNGLPAGNYIVRVTLPTGTVSTIDANPQADNDNPNINIDSNDNGDGGAGGTVTFDAGDYLIMNPGVDALKPNRTVTNANGSTIDPTIDFGFVELVAIGNRIWFDTGTGGGIANDGILNGGELGVADGLAVELHRSSDDSLVANTTTSTISGNTGYYQFDNLLPGTYYVRIPAVEFSSGRPLFGYVSSTGAGANETSDQNADENGIDGTPANPLTTVGIRTQNYVLTPNTESITDEHVGIYTGILDNNNVNFTADFGFVEAYGLGNRVWFDTNNDGVMNVGEQPVDGVQVQLYRADAGGAPTGAVLDTDITANGGYYLFDNLAPGNYVAVVTADNFNDTGTYNALVGYWSSRTSLSAAGAPTEILANTPDPDFGPDGISGNADDNLDSNDDNGTRQTSGAFSNAVISKAVTLGLTGLTEPISETYLEAVVGQGLQPDGRANMTVDFGFYRTEIGNLVFEDFNPNGTHDAGEPIIDGVSVRLYAADNATEILVGPDGILGSADDAANGVVTGPLAVIHPSWLNGEYHFSGLPAGDYIVRVVAPAGGISTIDTFNIADNNNPDTNADDNDNGVGEGTGTITSEITNRLTTTPGSTGANGNNTVNQATGTTTDPTVDFGIVPGYSLGNRIWFDTSNDGVLNADESGIGGVRVELYQDTNGDGTYNPGVDIHPATNWFTTTDASGYYRFDDLFPRDYVVVIPADNFLDTGAGDTVAADPLKGYWSSGISINSSGAISESATNDPDTDTDAYNNAASDENGTSSFSYYVYSAAVTLGATAEPLNETDVAATGQGSVDNRANMTVDFGFYQVEIGNLVFWDNNVSGHSNAGDAPINGALVHLYAADNITEIITGGDGISGTADDLFGPDGVSGGGDDGAGGVRTGPIALIHPTWANGEYRFSGLPEGNYIVKVETPTGATSTIDTNPQNDNDDPDVHVDNNDNGIGLGSGPVSAATLTMNAGEFGASAIGVTSDQTVDFGFVELVALGNRIWLDNGAGGGIANDGIQNGAEPGVNGVQVELYLSSQTPRVDTPVGVTATITDTDIASGLPGYYVFDGLMPGSYIVHIPASEFQSGQPLEGYYSSIGAGADETLDQNVDENGIDQPTPATTGVTSMTYVLLANSEPNATDNDGGYTGVLDDDNVNFTADFGFVQKYTLGNRVWFDTNDDSLMGAGEVGVDGVLVELYRVGQTPGVDAPLATDITAHGGYYLFDNLYPDNYIVAIAADNFIENGTNNSLVGYWSSLTTMGAAGATTETAAPDPDDTQGTPATTDDDVDMDDNGTRQAGGYVVSLPVTLGPSGNTEPTDEANVDTLEIGADHQGSQPNDRANMKVDFGFYKVEVGDLVYSDGVRDGTYVSADDAVLPGVLVHLFASDGITEIVTGADGILGSADDGWGPDGISGGASTDDGTGGMYTNAGGEYLFSGLPQGVYIITVTSPVGTGSTIDSYNINDTTTTGPDANVDNNDNGQTEGAGNISSGPVTLNPGDTGALTNNIITNSDGTTHNPTVDFGFIPAFSLGNRVWYDTNDNHLIDVDPAHPSDPLFSEVGINGVTVEVYAADISGNPTGPVLGSDTTVSNGADNGYYLFNPLPAGNYVVIIPASNFSGGVLNGYWSSGISRNADGSFAEVASPDPDNDTDSDDNGMYRTASGDVISKPITLGPNPTEPTTDNDNGPLGQGQPNNRGNMTVDFGFYTIGIGNLVWDDTDNSGAVNGVEAGMDNVDVQLWTADGLNMLGSTTTAAGGIYGFSGQPKGDYLVRIPALEFNPAGTLENYTSSTGVNSIVPPVPLGPSEPAPDTDIIITDSDDNGTETGGTLGLGGYIQTEIVTLNPTGENSYSNANGSTSESRVDFGVFYQLLHKPVIGSAKRTVSVVEVSPGAYDVTYEILVRNMGDVPLNSVQVTDNLSATFTAPTTAAVQSISGVGLTVNTLYNGSGNLLTGADSLAVGASGTITLVARVIPYKAGPFNNTAIASGTDPFGGAVVTDNSQDGADADPDKDGNPTNNNVPTPVNFGANIFDPPIGFKVFDDAGLPLLKWTMTWINSTNIAAVNARVSDPIPPGTVYVASGAPSGYPAPGTAPAGSTNIGVICSSPSAATTTTLCYYEGPTVANPLGRIVWEGTLGPDFGHTTADTAVNELNIVFNVNVPSGVTTAYNRATIDVDLNGDGIYDPSETVVANSQAIWVMRDPVGLNGRERRKASQLPSTGFAPGVTTILPEQPADKAYFTTGDIWLEIPRLGINTSVAGIPQSEDGTWDISWLWNQTGWLQGSAYPTLKGNSAITGHVYLPNGEPGPFVDLHTLAYGDKIIIHAFGQKYIYEVRENKQVKPSDTSVLKNEDKAWVTLITCLGYNEADNTYASRVAVRAILMTVEEEKTSARDRDR